MSDADPSQHLVFQTAETAPIFGLPVLEPNTYKLSDPWQIVLNDRETRLLYFTKWTEDASMEGTPYPSEATQFDLRLGVMVGLRKAVELRDTQYNPDRLYIVNAERTSIAQLIP